MVCLIINQHLTKINIKGQKGKAGRRLFTARLGYLWELFGFGGAAGKENDIRAFGAHDIPC